MQYKIQALRLGEHLSSVRHGLKHFVCTGLSSILVAAAAGARTYTRTYLRWAGVGVLPMCVACWLRRAGSAACRSGMGKYSSIVDYNTYSKYSRPSSNRRDIMLQCFEVG